MKIGSRKPTACLMACLPVYSYPHAYILFPTSFLLLLLKKTEYASLYLKESRRGRERHQAWGRGSKFSPLPGGRVGMT